MLAYSRDYGLAQFVGWAVFWQGWAMAEGGEWDGGIGQMRGGIESHRRIGSRVAMPHLEGILADVIRRQGDVTEALRLMDDALAECRENRDGFCEPELLILRGRALRDSG